MKLPNTSTIHRRLKCFVDFIAPELEKRDKIKQQSQDIRNCIERQAKDDGYIIAASANSGSFAKKTGLRRHLHGDSEVEGQDIDIGFILEPKDQNGDPVGCLIHKFEQYLKATWPESETGSTKSSATISFSGSKNRFDAVPLIKTDRADIQKLIRTTGEERQSSVQKQIKLIRNRNGDSDKIPGVVRFNDCLRLLKWWRYQQQSQSGVFGNGERDEKVPSFLLDLLSAKAYDECKVKETHAETLARWFGYLANIVRNRNEILFNDFIRKHKERSEALWKVIDPMDDSNNVTKNWANDRINELAEWFEKSRDLMNQAIRHDREGDDQASLDCLVALFGSPIKNHCKDA